MISIVRQIKQNSSQLFGGVLPGDATKGQNLCEIASPGGISLAVDRAQLASFVKAGNGVSADIEHPAMRVEFGSPLGVGTTRPHLGGIEGSLLERREDAAAKFGILVLTSILIERRNGFGQDRRLHLDATRVIHEFVRDLSGTDQQRQ